MTVMTTVRLTPTYIGDANQSGFYRLDLGGTGLSTLRSIQVHDDGQLSGGSAAASGFDLDSVALSSALTGTAAMAAGFTSQTAFDYGGAAFQPGFLRALVAGDPAFFNNTTLLGTTAGEQYSQGQATLNLADGNTLTGAGALSLGEGGAVTLQLATPLTSLSGQYLYFSDARENGAAGADGFYVLLSDDATIAADTGVSIVGTSLSDQLLLGLGANSHLGAGTDSIDGGDGADSIDGAGANDFIRGLNGADSISGGDGSDDVNGNMGDDTVHGAGGGDTVRGGQDSDLVYGDDGDDPHVNGNMGTDTVSGGNGADTVYGGQQGDSLMGDAGNDCMSGDLGDDIVAGGSGADRYYFRPGGGHDWVLDFQSGEGDRVALPVGTGFTLSSDASGQVLVTLAGGNDILGLAGVSMAQLGSDWMVFV
jgi:Ca2+-binding RTX toxin-like protein